MIPRIHVLCKEVDAVKMQGKLFRRIRRELDPGFALVTATT